MPKRRSRRDPAAPAGDAAAPGVAPAGDKLSLASLRAFAAEIRKRPLVAVPVAAAALVAGLAANFGDLKGAYEKIVPPRVDVRKIVQQLADKSPSVRLGALAQLAQVEIRKPEDVQLGVDTVALLIAREAGRNRAGADVPGATPLEASRAFAALGHLLALADKRKLTLRRPELAKLELSGIDLSGTYLRGIVVRDSDLHDARLGRADLQGSVLEDTQLAHADATGVDLRGGRLTRVCLEGAVLARAVLAGSIVSESDLNTATLSGSDLSAARFPDTRMNGAVMSDANASGADLSGATEWTAQQAAQLKQPGDVKLPAGYRRSLVKICG